MSQQQLIREIVSDEATVLSLISRRVPLSNIPGLTCSHKIHYCDYPANHSSSSNKNSGMLSPIRSARPNFHFSSPQSVTGVISLPETVADVFEETIPDLLRKQRPRKTLMNLVPSSIQSPHGSADLLRYSAPLPFPELPGVETVLCGPILSQLPDFNCGDENVVILIHKIHAEDLAWNHSFQKLTDTEQSKVGKFSNIHHKKHATASILLQRYLIRNTFNITDADYSILRTKENKPYLNMLKTIDGLSPAVVPPLWNYNVSHHGNYACIASSSTQLIGVDIVELFVRKTWTQGAAMYISQFKDQFSRIELSEMLKQPSDKEKYRYFFINWSLKEAFIKATGTGLYFDLKQIEFFIEISDCFFKCSGHTGCAGRATININGELDHSWNFEFKSLDDNHIVSIATGPISFTADSFRVAFPSVNFSGYADSVSMYDSDNISPDWTDAFSSFKLLPRLENITLDIITTF